MSRSERVEALFHAALDQDTAARPGFLAHECGSDVALLKDVQALLEGDAEAEDTFREPAPNLVLGVLPAELEGRRVGAYTVGRRLAIGGMGAVYAATQEHPQRTVALKVMRSDLADPDLERRFRYEADLLARLQHPYIATVHEAGVFELASERLPYIAMELVPDAEPIDAFAKAHDLGLRPRIELFTRVCEAVHHGHQRGIIHRDLKPGNVLVDPEGRPKLIDFGIARAADPDASRATRTGTLLGTVAYMSPEQCEDARDIDVRSDVYSLGVLLYELLCGRLPYDLDGVPIPRATRIVQEHDPRRPSTLHAALRGDVETILLKALEKDRERRYASVEDLRRDLARFLAGEAIAARPPSLGYQLGLFARRHKLAAVLVLGLFAVCVAAAIVSTGFAVKTERARRDERVQGALASLAAADASLRVYDAAEARRHLEAVPPDLREWEWSYLNGLLDLDRVALEIPTHLCHDAVWYELDGPRVLSAWASDEKSYLVELDPVTGRELVRVELAVHPNEVDVSLPQGLVAVSGSTELQLWAAKLERLVWSIEPSSGVFSGVAFDPAGERLAAITSAGECLVVRTVDGETLARWQGAAELHALAWDPAGERIGLAGEDGTVRLWDPRLADAPRVLEGHRDAATAVGFGPRGKWIATGSRDRTVRLWDAATGEELERLSGHGGEVRDCVFSPDGALLLTASTDRMLKLWSLADTRDPATLYGHQNWVQTCAFSPDGATIVSGSTDGTLRLWDAEPRRTNDVVVEHAGLVRDVAFSPDGRWLAAASSDGTVSLVDLESRTQPVLLSGHGERVMCVAFDPGSSLLASGSNDKTVRIWDLVTLECLAVLGDSPYAVHALAFRPDGERLADGAFDGTVRLWNTATWQLERTLTSSEWTMGLAYSPDGSRLVAAGRQALTQWDDATGAVLFDLSPDEELASVAFHPTGRLIATAARRGDVTLRDPATGAVRARLAAPADRTAQAYDAAFHPDGTRLAAAYSTGVVRLWDLDNERTSLILRGHRSWVFAVAFHPDGRRLASGGGNYDGLDPTVRLWEARGEAAD